MRVLITNCTRNAGLSTLRALRQAGFDVLGADDRQSPLGLRSRHSIAPYLRLPPQESPDFSRGLLEILERERADALIVTRGVEAAIRARANILQCTRTLLPTATAFDAVNDKAQLLTRCTALGIPASRLLSQDEAVAWLRSHPGERVVVKPRLDMGGGEGVSFVADADRLANVYASTSDAYSGAIITEYVRGPVSNLHAAHLLFDGKSRLIAFFVLRKLRIWPDHVGVTVAAVSTHETEMVEQLVPLFESLGWQGPADAEFKVDELDGQAKVLEINPRFSGAIHFPNSCGVNMPAMLCRAALGEDFPRAVKPAYQAGIHYIDTMRWTRSILGDLRSGAPDRRTVLARALSELRQPRVPSVHVLTDPAPTLAKLWLGLCP
jgi:carbamoyl-phosphate synthase large subunit